MNYTVLLVFVSFASVVKIKGKESYCNLCNSLSHSIYSFS